MSNVIYICAHARSGSTLLDQLLGAHPDICTVGEILHLNAYALNDRSQYDPAHELICSCGESVTGCDFWSGVEKNIGRPIESFQLDPYATKRNGIVSMGGRLRKFCARQVENRPNWYDYSIVKRVSGGSLLGRESFKLFDAIGEISGSRNIIDSSKSIFRFLSLYYEQPERVKLVLLGRDYRGVAYSKMQRGRTLERSVAGWSRKLQQMEMMSQLIPERSVTRIRYEDLCADPKSTLLKLCKFLEVRFDPDVLDRSLSGLHHIGGSPSKFTEEKQAIKLDTRYQTAFSDDQLGIMKDIVGPEAKKWGYT